MRASPSQVGGNKNCHSHFLDPKGSPFIGFAGSSLPTFARVSDTSRFDLSSIDAFAYVLLAKMGSFKRAFNWFDFNCSKKITNVTWDTGGSRKNEVVISKRSYVLFHEGQLTST